VRPVKAHSVRPKTRISSTAFGRFLFIDDQVSEFRRQKKNSPDFPSSPDTKRFNLSESEKLATDIHAFQRTDIHAYWIFRSALPTAHCTTRHPMSGVRGERPKRRCRPPISSPFGKDFDVEESNRADNRRSGLGRCLRAEQCHHLWPHRPWLRLQQIRLQEVPGRRGR
jgi:hypothetical protein